MPSLIMTTSIVSEESFARDTQSHTHSHTDSGYSILKHIKEIHQFDRKLCNKVTGLQWYIKNHTYTFSFIAKIILHLLLFSKSYNIANKNFNWLAYGYSLSKCKFCGNSCWNVNSHMFHVTKKCHHSVFVFMCWHWQLIWVEKTLWSKKRWKAQSMILTIFQTT